MLKQRVAKCEVLAPTLYVTAVKINMTNTNIVAAIFLLGLSALNPPRFQAIRTAPSPPIPVMPSNHATAVRINPTFVWSSSTGAQSYHLQVSTDSTFAAAIIDRPTLTDTTLRVTGLSHKTIYYWRVNSTGANGTTTFSTTFSFRSHVTPGDFNGSGEIQGASASLILRHVANIAVLTGDALETAEVSGDETVSAYDAALVLQVAAGLLSGFPVDW
jgi:hypothetical protein